MSDSIQLHDTDDGSVAVRVADAMEFHEIDGGTAVRTITDAGEFHDIGERELARSDSRCRRRRSTSAYLDGHSIWTPQAVFTSTTNSAGIDSRCHRFPLTSNSIRQKYIPDSTEVRSPQAQLVAGVDQQAENSFNSTTNLAGADFRRHKVS